MPLPRSCFPLQCGLCLSEEAGYPGNAANHRCHIWHNEKTQERLEMSRWETDRVTLNFSARIQSKKTVLMICIQNKVSLKISKDEGRQHSFANCSCCVFNQQPCRFPFLPFFTPALLFTTEGEHMQMQLQDICIAVNN